MSAPKFDPLALRYGAHVSAVWSEINEARASAQTRLGPRRAAALHQQMCDLREQIGKIRNLERAGGRFPRQEVDDWFAPVLTCLTRAADHFAARHAAHPVSLTMDRQAATSGATTG